jgi:DNA-directed RNA polymerase subunit RPC12/RpoP
MAEQSVKNTGNYTSQAGGAMNKKYNGESEACLDCKAYFRDTDNGAPCDTCSYRIREAEKLRRVKEGKG